LLVVDEQANQARINDLEMRIQVMQQRMQMKEQQAKYRETAMTQSDLRALARDAGNDPQRMTDAMQARSDKQQRDREQAAKDERASLLSRVQQRVPQGAVLLEMVKYRPIDPKAPDAKRPERYGTFVVRAAGEPANLPDYIDLGEAAPLEKLIAEFRTALASPERPGARDLGRKLDLGHDVRTEAEVEHRELRL